MTDRATMGRWVAAYEVAWRTPGTEELDKLFSARATYLQSPYEEPVVGLEAIRQMWEDERDGPQEVFTLATDIIAVEGTTGVVRAEVRYGDPVSQEYRDVWIVRLEDNGRCCWFEEWPFWPDRGYDAPESGSYSGS